MRINLLLPAFGMSTFVLGQSAQACVADVPVFSVQDLSTAMFVGGSLLCLAVLTYMHFPAPVRSFIRRGLKVSAIGIGIFGVFAAAFVYWQNHTVTATTAAPTTLIVSPVPISHPASHPAASSAMVHF